MDALVPVEARPLRFPPGYVEIRLGDPHRRAYRHLYARFRTYTDDLPVLRDRDFDGRPVRITKRQFEALSREFARLAAAPSAGDDAFGRQEAGRNSLFKRLQYLS
jgi:hypothetical protein